MSKIIRYRTYCPKRPTGPRWKAAIVTAGKSRKQSKVPLGLLNQNPMLYFLPESSFGLD